MAKNHWGREALSLYDETKERDKEGEMTIYSEIKGIYTKDKVMKNLLIIVTIKVKNAIVFNKKKILDIIERQCIEEARTHLNSNLGGLSSSFKGRVLARLYRVLPEENNLLKITSRWGTVGITFSTEEVRTLVNQHIREEDSYEI